MLNSCERTISDTCYFLTQFFRRGGGGGGEAPLLSCPVFFDAKPINKNCLLGIWSKISLFSALSNASMVLHTFTGPRAGLAGELLAAIMVC